MFDPLKLYPPNEWGLWPVGSKECDGPDWVLPEFVGTRYNECRVLRLG